MELSEEGRGGVGQVVYCVGAAGEGRGLVPVASPLEMAPKARPLRFTGKCIKTTKNC